MRRILLTVVAVCLLAAGLCAAAPSAHAARQAGAAASPAITSVTPALRSAGTGSLVTIRGSRFGTLTGSARVEFTYQEPAGQTRQYIPASNVLLWNNTRIVCEVPTDNNGYTRSASTGPLRIITADGATSKGFPFAVTFGYLWRLPEPARHFVIVANNVGWRKMIKAAGRTWTESGHFRFSFTEATSGNPSVGNNVSEIYWGDVGNTSTLAHTVRTGLETDIVFNRDLWWGSWVPLKYDVQSIALHELGHVVGLRDLYGGGDRGKVMYGWNTRMGPTGSFLTWTWGRHRQLSDADISGARWVNSGGAARGKIALVSGGGIWTVRSDGTELRRLTGGDLGDRGLTWSPDHGRIAFIRGEWWYWDESENLVDPTTLWMMDSDGSNLHSVSYSGPSLTACGFDLAWSPDGRYIAGADMVPSNGYFICEVTVLDLQTMTSRVVTSLSDWPGLTPFSLDWSPDSRRLAVCTCLADPGPTWIVDVATGRRLRKFDFDADGAWGAYKVSWKPDGSRLLMNVDHVSGHRSELWSPAGRRLVNLGRDRAPRRTREPVSCTPTSSMAPVGFSDSCAPGTTGVG